MFRTAAGGNACGLPEMSNMSIRKACFNGDPATLRQPPAQTLGHRLRADASVAAVADDRVASRRTLGAANGACRIPDGRSTIAGTGVGVSRKGEAVADSFKPTAKMASNAKQGLELRAKFNRGGTEVGVHRAEQLVEQAELTEDDVKSMHSYFARHAVDKEGKTHVWGSHDDPSAGYIAWLLWGGDEGQAWADRHAARLHDRDAG